VHPLRLINLSTLQLSDTPEQVCLFFWFQPCARPMKLTWVTASRSWLAPLALQLQPALISPALYCSVQHHVAFHRGPCPGLVAHSCRHAAPHSAGPEPTYEVIDIPDCCAELFCDVGSLLQLAALNAAFAVFSHSCADLGARVLADGASAAA
jgi:hypothetical protein